MSKKESQTNSSDFKVEPLEVNLQLQTTWRKELGDFFSTEGGNEYKKLDDELIRLGNDFKKVTTSQTILNNQKLFSLCWAIVDHYIPRLAADNDPRLFFTLFHGLNSILNRYLENKISITLSYPGGTGTFSTFLLDTSRLRCLELYLKAGDPTGDPFQPQIPIADIKLSDLNLITASQLSKLTYKDFIDFFVINFFQRCINALRSERLVQFLKKIDDEIENYKKLLSNIMGSWGTFCSLSSQVPIAIVFIFLLKQPFLSSDFKQRILTEEIKHFTDSLPFIPLSLLELIYSYLGTPAYCFFEEVDNDKEEKPYAISTKGLREMSFLVYHKQNSLEKNDEIQSNSYPSG